MFCSRSKVLSKVPKILISTISSGRQQPFTSQFNYVHSFIQSPNKLGGSQVSVLSKAIFNNSIFHPAGFSSSASHETSETENIKPDGQGSGDSKLPDETEGQTKDSDSNSDLEDELSKDELVKLVAEKDALLLVKRKEIENMKDKVLRSYAEMENVMNRTKREAENSKKFAIQNFAKGLLDVADNLGRASSVVRESYFKIDGSKDTVGAVPLLKTLLDGVEMTDKLLVEVFRKFGVKKFDPTNEVFDPHRHNAVFQVSDCSKPPGTVSVVMKSGYMLYDRVIRPAEVGVTKEVDSGEANEGA